MDEIKLMTAIIACVCITEVGKTVLWWVVCGTCKLLLRRLTPGEWLRKTLTGMLVCALVVAGVLTLGVVDLPPTETVSWLLLAGTVLSLWVAVRELTTLFGLVSGDWNPRTGRLRFFTGARLKLGWGGGGTKSRRIDPWCDPYDYLNGPYNQRYCNCL